MLLQPNRTKFKKLKKKYLTSCIETRSFKLHQGKIGLKAIESFEAAIEDWCASLLLRPLVCVQVKEFADKAQIKLD